MEYRGQGWSQVPTSNFGSGNIGSWFSGLSCAAPTLCKAVGALNAPYSGDSLWNFDGLTWSQDTLPGFTGDALLNGINCPTTAFCMVVGDEIFPHAGGGGAAIVTFNGSTWTRQPETPSVQVPQSVSCWSSDACISGSENGAVSSYASGTWSAPMQIDDALSPLNGSPYTIFSISCPSSAFCMAVDSSANTMVYK
jgi:hypothetical protein